MPEGLHEDGSGLVDGEQRPCLYCERPLTWEADRGIWTGYHALNCPMHKQNVKANAAALTKVTDNTTGLDQVIGPSGQPLWKATFKTRRSGVRVTEITHVRARTYDGAVLVLRETRPDAPRDAEIQEVRTTEE